MRFKHFQGVYAAAVTPLHPDGSFDREGLFRLFDFLTERGCHGALIMGTTGEGPSFSVQQRTQIMKAASNYKQTRPDFQILAGTGTPSLEETILLSRTAFDLELDGVLVLPPYYFRNATTDGLFSWFDRVLSDGVPGGGALFGYHIPPVTGVPLQRDLLSRLFEAHPDKFAGIKDSSGSLEDAEAFGEPFGKDMVIFNGTDRILSEALKFGASGAITALANLVSPDLRTVWDAFQIGEDSLAAQERLAKARTISERFPPAAPFLKMLLGEFHDFPNWGTLPPLLPIDPFEKERAVLAWKTRGQMA